MNTCHLVMTVTIPKSVSHAVCCTLREIAHAVSKLEVMYSKRCIESDLQSVMLSMNQPEAK